MKNQTSLPQWVGLCALALFAFASFGTLAEGAPEGKQAMETGRPDVVTIDAMARDGKLELPPVTFLHDQHTSALAKQDKDCRSCHKPVTEDGEGGFSFNYLGSDTLKGDALKSLYHESCIGCHKELAAKNAKTGPLEAECRSCHNPGPMASSWQDIGFDKILHYKHTVASTIKPVNDPKLNCGACHHVYDEGAQKLVWGKEKEDSCRACHKLPEEQKAALAKDPGAKDKNGELAKRPTFDVAAHQSCVNCHLVTQKLDLAGVKSGPVDCAGCHSPATRDRLKEELANKAVAGSIPRLMRGQPDAALMLPVDAADGGTAKEVKGSMRPVSFNHAFHEGVTDNCRSCHHKEISSCVSCHTVGGQEEGGFVPLSQAMHKANSDRSCVGCHNVAKEVPACAGCHISLPKGMTVSSCDGCHSVPPGVSVENAENGSLLQLGKEDKARLASAAAASRQEKRVTTFAPSDIPETVTIGALSNEYEPSVLPHGKIVETLLKKQVDNRLASVFHAQATLCAGCHHNSPLSKTPPKCVNCHGVDIKTSYADGRPTLKAAYHLQCMTCHAAMQQKPLETECNDCHKPRGKQ